MKKRQKDTTRERERENEAAEAERRERIGDTSWRLRTHSSRDRAATGGTHASVYAGRRERRRERGKERESFFVFDDVHP